MNLVNLDHIETPRKLFIMDISCILRVCSSAMFIGAYSALGPHIAGDNRLTLGQNIFIYVNFISTSYLKDNYFSNIGNP
jgi:hypothetical protein